MYYKKFQEMSISALGMGGLRFPFVPGRVNEIDRDKGAKLIDAAIKSGINYFDTAYTYQNGDSERFLGEVLSQYPRDSYYLATKYYAAAGKSIEDVFEEQLKRCKTDYFDFYLLHSLDENYIEDYMDPKTDNLGFLLKQKKEGRIKKIGFSSHASPGVLKRFLDWYDGFDMALIQLNYLDFTLLDGKRQYELLTEHGIPVWVMEPMKGGRLSVLNEKAVQILKEVSPDRSVSSWGFRFLMGLKNVQTILSGMSDIDQLNDNCATFAKCEPLNEKERAALKEASEVFLKDLGVPCSACRYCCETCPAGLDIPLLIQGYNEHRISGETWKIAELERTKGPGECLGCKRCLSHCPQKINIPEIMKEYAAVYGK